MTSYSDSEIKTKQIYVDQHNNYMKDDSIFQRHLKNAVNPRSYNLDPEFFIGKHVLDIGCGNSGYFQVAMHSLGARKITCLDIGTSWQNDLRDILAKHDVPSDFFECVDGNATMLPFSDGTFDFVASNGVLMHLETVDLAEVAIREMSRVTVNGGVVYAYIGIDKPGIVDRYIVKSLRQAYVEDDEFREWVDNLTPDSITSEISSVYSEASTYDNSNICELAENFKDLFTLDSVTFIQNLLQVPIQQASLLSENWGTGVMRAAGLTDVRRVQENYWVRNDFRKYLAPFHFAVRDSKIARLMYGNGHVKLSGWKR
jgi:ubiquinone/menaquinone biosynthesis C-methylase UbiE